MSNKYPSIPVKTLAAELSSSGSLLVLSDIEDWGGTDLTTSHFSSDYIPFTLMNDAGTLLEFGLLTASTIANATAGGATIYKRGLNYYATGVLATDQTEVTANKLDWTSGETKVLLGTHSPYLFSRFVNKDNDETIVGLHTFPNGANTPVLGSSYVAPTGATQVASKGYVDAVVSGGSVTYDQQKFSGTAGEALSAFDLIYFKESDQRWWKTDADALATAQNVKLGIAAAAVASGGDSVSVITSGKITGMSGLTAGARYFVSNTAGAMVATTPGTLTRVIGWAETTTVFYFFPDGTPSGVIFDIAGENLTAGQLVYFKTSDQKWWKTDADAAATSIGVQLGICQATVLADAAGMFRISGIDTSNTGLTAGARYFVSATAGGLVATTPGTFQRYVGIALSTQELLLGNDPYVLTQTGQEVYAADAGANDTYVITRVPAPAALKTGMVIWVKHNTANTGTATINDTGLGAVTCVKGINTTLNDGDIAAGSIHGWIYDGTNYRLIGPTDNVPTYTQTWVSGLSSITGTGTVTIAHGLGRTPTFIRITGSYGAAGNAHTCVGTAQSTSSRRVTSWGVTGASDGQMSTSSSLIVLIELGSGANDKTYADLATLDATNIELSATKEASGVNVNLIWEAFG